MKAFVNWIPAILIAVLGALLLALGVYSLATATSNIPSFRLFGLAPAMLGAVMIAVAPLTKGIE